MDYIELPYLSILIFMPLVGALFTALARGNDGKNTNISSIAIVTSGAAFLLSAALFFVGDFTMDAFLYRENLEWLPGLGIRYSIGVDGVSMFFVLLSTLLTFLALLLTAPSIGQRVKEYCIAFLVLETFMVGTFCAMDLFLFYIFFEGVLIPMFFIIGIWGGKKRVYATWKFFLYTLLGSVLMLVAIIYLYFEFGTSDIYALYSENVDLVVQRWLWLAFFASFAVKMPMFPVHTWLPDAHVEAPTAGSILLAGVLLKMGGYGLYRISLPIFPDASQFFAMLVFILSGIAVVYASMVAFAQTDMKKLIAYSSVAHMGFVTAGLFTFSEYGIQGALFQMISHGFISAALFMVVGVLYARTHTRKIAAYGGVAKVLPAFAVLAMVFTLGSLGLPGTSGFVGEFMIILATYTISGWLAATLGTGMILGAVYGLWLYRKVMFGATKELCASLRSTTVVEGLSLGTLAILVMFFGLFPQYFFTITEPSVRTIVEKTQNMTVLTVLGGNTAT